MEFRPFGFFVVVRHLKRTAAIIHTKLERLITLSVMQHHHLGAPSGSEAEKKFKALIIASVIPA